MTHSSGVFHLLGVRRFLPLFVTQLLGAFNDNLFKHAVVLFVVYNHYNDENSETWFSALTTALSRRCLATVAAGVLAGLLGFWAMRRILTSWLFNMTPSDPLVLTSAVALLALVAALASWIPTRRATRLDPATALRLD